MIISWLLIISFYLLVFSNDPRFGLVTQIASLAFLLGYAIQNLLMGRVRKRGFTSFDVVFITATLLSFLTSLAVANLYSAYFSIAFAIVVFSSFIIVRSVPHTVVLQSWTVAMVAAVGTVAIVYPNELILSLGGKSVFGIGLIRFEPFGMHPNLTGYIYGSTALVMLITAQYNRGAFKVIALIAALVAFAVVLAASARAGVVSLTISLLIIGALGLYNIRAKTVISLIALAAISTLLFSLNSTIILSYFESILDLKSETRGLDSGGSGRVELWVRGIDLIGSRNPFHDVFGSGLRSAVPELIGFSTENSYITLILEFGIVFGSSLILYLFFALFKAIRRNRSTFPCTKSSKEKVRLRVEVGLIVFALTHAVFNRYLIAIGNPTSLYFMLLLAGLFGPKQSFRKHTPAKGKGGSHVA